MATYPYFFFIPIIGRNASRLDIISALQDRSIWHLLMVLGEHNPLGLELDPARVLSKIEGLQL